MKKITIATLLFISSIASAEIYLYNRSGKEIGWKGTYPINSVKTETRSGTVIKDRYIPLMHNKYLPQPLTILIHGQSVSLDNKLEEIYREVRQFYTPQNATLEVQSDNSIITYLGDPRTPGNTVPSRPSTLNPADQKIMDQKITEIRNAQYTALFYEKAGVINLWNALKNILPSKSGQEKINLVEKFYQELAKYKNNRWVK